MDKESELIKELENSYREKDLIWCYELCNELYELKAYQKLGKDQKYTLKGLIEMQIRGLKPDIEDIKTAVYGLIELAIASKQ